MINQMDRGKMSAHYFRPFRVKYGILLICLITACASTGGGDGGYGPPPIVEGKGRLFLAPAGINKVNFYSRALEPGEEV